MDELVLIYADKIFNVDGFHQIFKEDEPLDLAGDQAIYSIVISYKDKGIEPDYIHYDNKSKRDFDFVSIINAINSSERFLKSHDPGKHKPSKS